MTVLLFALSLLLSSAELPVSTADFTPSHTDSLLIVCKMCEMFSYFSASFSESQACRRCGRFIAVESRLSKLDAQLSTQDSIATTAARGTVRVMLFDFSSAFNTIKPSLLRRKIEDKEVDQKLVPWTTDYFTNGP